MRKTERIKIDAFEITVKELTVKEIIGIGKISTSEDFDFMDFIKSNLTLVLEGITIEDMMEMAPSDLKFIYEKFKEINGTFFEFAQQVGMEDLLRELMMSIRKDFLRIAVG
jgi:hypothetical protein